MTAPTGTRRSSSHATTTFTPAQVPRRPPQAPADPRGTLGRGLLLAELREFLLVGYLGLGELPGGVNGPTRLPQLCPRFPELLLRLGPRRLGFG